MPVVLKVLTSRHTLRSREEQKLSDIRPRLISGNFLGATHPHNADEQLHGTDRPSSNERVRTEW